VSLKPLVVIWGVLMVTILAIDLQLNRLRARTEQEEVRQHELQRSVDDLDRSVRALEKRMAEVKSAPEGAADAIH